MSSPPTLTVRFYQDAHGRFPARDWIAQLDAKSRARVERTISLLEAHGPTLVMPHSRHVRGKLWELRISHARLEFRLLYFGTARREFILVHAFAKKTSKTPERELAIAEARMADYWRRHPAPPGVLGSEPNAPS